ncbi:hypothetical protein BDY19DRAFT_203908 [Irpex rosettiformis]|uniref:Uncharacterized protein n=1 Tax=Irpex rosettiformis TaxID=378272 RepID=A0ACB8U106_9APHY|nr:hypothetical protein BDY19DRAFT_203908 [Irpex rosettiformis]
MITAMEKRIVMTIKWFLRIRYGPSVYRKDLDIRWGLTPFQQPFYTFRSGYSQHCSSFLIAESTSEKRRSTAPAYEGLTSLES